MLVALLRVSIIGHMLNKSDNIVYEAADRWLNIKKRMKPGKTKLPSERSRGCQCTNRTRRKASSCHRAN